MPILPLLAVVFVGIGGDDAARVDKQMSSLLHKDAKVESASVPAAALRVLGRHGEGAGEIARNLHADGVIAGELIASHGQVTLRVVVYGGDGGMKDLVETPLSGRQLGRADIEALRSNLMPDVVDLAQAARGGANDDAPSGDDEPSLPIAPALKHQAAPARHREAPAPPRSRNDDADADAPTGVDGATEASHEAAPTETADASDTVSADEALGLAMGTDDSSGGGGGGGGGSIDTGATASDGLRMRAALGFGITGRDFAPGPMSVAGYASAPVGAVRLDAEVQPTARTSLALVAERALGMSTPGLADGAAPTSLSRWQVSGAYELVHGAVAIAPMVGVGGRDFGIDSKDPSRSPDSHYAYVVAGATMSTAIGSRIALGGIAAVEPVFGGSEPTEMAFGEASRWALELGATVEVRATSHLFVRGGFDWQRFSWSWDQAGARGAGGAIDSYPSGTLSVGANY